MLNLITIPYSHYCEKARWALDRSGLEYVELAHAPFFHAYHNKRAGAKRTVPSLITPEKVYTDSSDILDFVHASGTLLYPDAIAASIRSWEQRFDKEFGIKARAWAYIYFQQMPHLLHEILEQGTPQEYKILKPLVPQILQFIVKNYRAFSSRREKLERDMNALLDQCDFMLRDGRPFFCGDVFTAADISLCSLFGVLLIPPEYGFTYPALEKCPEEMQKTVNQWRERPTGKYILKMYSTQRNLVPA